MLRAVRWIAVATAFLALAAAGVVVWMFSDRPELGEVGPSYAAEAAPRDAGDNRVTATWLGVTTLIFDDGETQILIDGFFSRATMFQLLRNRPIAPNLVEINRAIQAHDLARVAAIIPVHSHYDHAMDVGETAKATGAFVVGSESSANIARGAGLAEERIIVADAADEGYDFGDFKVRLIPSNHAPLREGTGYGPGLEIDAPLVPPAPPQAWREGGSFSVIVDHPRGAALVQGSAGYQDGALVGEQADVVFLSVGGLAGFSDEHSDAYWRNVVEATGPSRVFPVHYDDFITRPFGRVAAPPRFFDDAEASLKWAAARADKAELRFEQLRFGESVDLY